MRKMLAAVVAAIAGTSTGEAAARCNVERFTGNPNAVTTVRMQVSAGERCTIRHMTTRYGKSEQRRFPTSMIALGGRPQHGSVTINGSRVTYAPSKGYTGGDTFTYTTHHAPVRGEPRAYRYQIAVSVN